MENFFFAHAGSLGTLKKIGHLYEDADYDAAMASLGMLLSYLLADVIFICIKNPSFRRRCL